MSKVQHFKNQSEQSQPLQKPILVNKANGSASKPKNLKIQGKPNQLSNQGKLPMIKQKESISHERHVSFDKQNYHSQGLVGISKSPIIDAQSVSNAYQTSIGNEKSEADYTVGAKLNCLAEEYRQRQQRMDSRLKQEIENNAIGSLRIVDPLSGLKSPLNPNQELINVMQAKDAKFFRSQRSVAMRIKDSYEVQVQKLETDKLQLIQKLNDALVQLDRLNQEKSQISEKLIEMLKFVRDMQRETQKGEDLTAVVNDELRGELRSEKELSHQLKEELKKAEMERLRILQRIHELSQITSEGELVQNDMNIDLTVKVRTVQDLQQEYVDVKSRIEELEKEIEHLRAVTIANQEHIHKLKDRIEKIVDEKRALHQKINQTQDKLDQAIETYSRDREDIDRKQIKNVKCISINILFETINQAYNRGQLFCIYLMLKIADEKNRNKIGLKKMSKILKNHRKYKLKKYLYLWFTNGLQPMKTKTQKYILSLQMRHKYPSYTAFYKWQCVFQKSQKIKHIKRQVIQSMLQRADCLNQKAIKFFWTKWRDLIRLTDDDKKRIIQKYILKKHRHHVGYYFNQWKQINLECSSQIQLHSLAQRLTFRKYLSFIFNQWRIVTTDIKLSRKATLNRVWKNFQANVINKKQMRCQTLCVLREEKKRTQNLIKACFDSWRQHKEKKKYEKTIKYLHEVEIPRKKQVQEMIEKVTIIDNERFRTRAVQAVQKCLSKQIFYYFQNWKTFTEKKTNGIKQGLKMRILKCYLQHLRQALNRWIEFKGSKMIQFQSEVIESHEEEIKQAQVQIVEAKQEIQEKQQRQQCQSGKQMKKIFSTAFQNRLREHFLLWKANLDHKSFVQDKTEKVMYKLNRRQKRHAFQQYAHKIKEFKKLELFNKQVEEIRFKLREKMRHRIFNAIRLFAYNHLSAKNYMRRLLMKLDLSLKDSSFKKWLRYKHHSDEKILQTLQNKKVDHLSILESDKNQRADALQDLNQQVNKLNNTLSNNARRILRLAFQRQMECSQQYGFAIWREWVDEEIRKERVMRKALTHMMRNTTCLAFRIWKKYRSDFVTCMYSESITSNQKQMENIESQRKQLARKHTVVQDQVGTRISKLQEAHQDLMTKHANTLRAIMNRVSGMDCMSKQRYILQQWHNYVTQRKRALYLLEKGINKSIWDVGFKAIRMAAKEKQKQDQKDEHSSQIIRAYFKVRVRQTFNVWRKNIQLLATKKRNDCQKELSLIIRKHDNFRALVQNRLEDQLKEHFKHKKLFDTFVSWKSYIQTKKLLQVKIKTYDLQSNQRDKERSIIKWANRAKSIRRNQHLRQKIDIIYEKNLMSSVYNAWHDYKHINKNLCKSLNSMASLLNKVYLKRTFNHIKTDSQCKQYKIRSKKARSCIIMTQILQQIAQQTRQQAWVRLEQQSLTALRLKLGQKSILKYHLSKSIRSYFEEWKQESQRRSVIKQMNEDGPVAVEVHNLKKKLYNLKHMTVDEGIEPQQINQMLKDSEQEAIQKIEKSICRLFCYNEDLYLLPKTLDRWKQWVQYRKSFRYWLNYLNKKADTNTSGLYWVFKKWKYSDLDRLNGLESMTKPQLLQLDYKNQQKMDKTADELDIADGTINDLDAQRDLLVRRYVGSQRLALAVTTSSCERAKFKAFSQWISAKSSCDQSELEEQLKRNLDRIKFLKDRIKHFEYSNEELADQNEELRQGALDGIEMAKTIDDLTREREKLSVDLADKAITIRKLLEDNNNLSIRLSHAQEEAQTLIKMSQIRLHQSEQRGLQYVSDDF